MDSSTARKVLSVIVVSTTVERRLCEAEIGERHTRKPRQSRFGPAFRRSCRARRTGEIGRRNSPFRTRLGQSAARQLQHGEQHRAEDRWSDKYPVRDHRLDRFQPSCLFSTKITKDTKDSTSSPPRRRRRSERVQKINLCDLCVPAVKFLFSSLLAALPRCVLRGEIFRL